MATTISVVTVKQQYSVNWAKNKANTLTLAQQFRA